MFSCLYTGRIKEGEGELLDRYFSKTMNKRNHDNRAYEGPWKDKTH